MIFDQRSILKSERSSLSRLPVMILIASLTWKEATIVTIDASTPAVSQVGVLPAAPMNSPVPEALTIDAHLPEYTAVE